MKPSVEKIDASTIRLTFLGKSRKIAVRDVWGDGKKLISLKANGVCKHRTGKKLHRVGIEFFLKDGDYRMQSQYCILNKQAILIGWLEDYKDNSGLLSAR